MADGTVVINTSLNTSPVRRGLNDIRRNVAGMQGHFRTVGNTIGSAVGVGLNRIQSDMRGVGRSVQSTGRTITTGLTLPIVGSGIAAGVIGVKFEDAMAKVRATTGASAKEFKMLEDTAKLMGRTTRFSATEAAEGMQFLSLAGFDVNQIIAATPKVLKLATAGALDLGRASDIATDVLSGFGLEVKDLDRLLDVMAKTATSSNTNIEQMGNAMSYVGPIASGLELSLEETSAALGILADAGLKGERGGTALRGVLTSLINPVGGTQRALEKLGLSAEDVDPQIHGLAGVLKNLEDAGMDSKTAMELVGVEAGPAMINLMRAGSKGLNEFTGDLEGASGSLDRMAAIMEDTTGGSIRGLLSALEGVALAVYDRLQPTIETVTDILRDLAEAISEAPPWLIDMVIAFAGLLAVAGPLLVVIGSVLSFIGALSGAAAALGVTMGTLLVTIGWIVAAIAAVIAIVVLVIYYWDEIKAATIFVWDAIVAAIKAAWDWIKETVMSVAGPLIEWVIDKFNLAMEVITEIWDGLSQFFSGVWEVIKNIFIGALLLLLDLVTGDFEALEQDAKAIWENIKNALGDVWEGIKQIFNAALKWLIGLVGGDFDSMQGKIDEVWKRIESIISDVWEFIKNTFRNALAFVKALVSGDFEGMKKAIVNQMKNVQTNLGSAWEKIKSLFSSAGERIKTVARDKFEAMKQSIRDKMNQARDAIKSAWDKSVSFLKGIDLRQIGRDIIQGLINGITSMGRSLMNKANELANSVKDKFRSVLKIASPSKVFEQYGRWTGEGFAIGMERTVGDIASSADLMVQAAVPEIKVPQDVAIPAVSRGPQMIAPEYVVVKIGTHEFVKAVTRDISREQYRLATEQRRGRGI